MAGDFVDFFERITSFMPDPQGGTITYYWAGRNIAPETAGVEASMTPQEAEQIKRHAVGLLRMANRVLQMPADDEALQRPSAGESALMPPRQLNAANLSHIGRMCQNTDDT